MATDDRDAPDGVDARRLATAPLEVVGRFTVASNATLLVRLCDGGGGAGAEPEDVRPSDLAVYKPARGEAPLWDFPEGTLHRREIAAYRVDRALGWSLVPVTVLRSDGPYGHGSIQRFVPHDPDRHFFALLEEAEPTVERALQRMVLLDLVLNNADRKGGHVLVEEEPGAVSPAGTVVRLVDHGVTFHEEPKVRTVGWHLAGTPIPPVDRVDVHRLIGDLEGELGTDLTTLLDPAEVVALAGRAAAVAALEVFPEPAGPRPYPWPLL